MSTRILLRRGLASQWTSTNPVLALGEAGYESDMRRLKIGDGFTNWNQLPYFSGSGAATIAGLSDVDVQGKVDGSILVYDSISSKFVADDITTKITLTDGGNF